MDAPKTELKICITTVIVCIEQLDKKFGKNIEELILSDMLIILKYVECCFPKLQNINYFEVHRKHL